MKSLQKSILIYADWDKNQLPQQIGTLYATPARGNEVFSFEYSSNWLKHSTKTMLDPDLQLFKGSQYLNDDKYNFGVFLDSSPDRWGRMLMRRREALLARKDKRAEKKLLESDYLLGVYDQQRVGGLRFKLKENGAFLNDNKLLSTPPWSTLKELEFASFQIENKEVINDEEYLKWLNMLMYPGSSLGGARPKAGILDSDNNLWIAKFPSLNDDKDIGAWEMVVNELAYNANINVATGMLKKLSNKHHTYLSKRFDRDNHGNRLHFASAMTMLGYQDGANEQIGVSYLEIAEFLMEHGANVNKDLEELWRRIVFYICISNTDDHLRNHGFILTNKGWILSPAYDINPVEFAGGLSLNISENDNSLNLDLAKEVAIYFRVSAKNANKIVKETINVTREWRKYAEKYHILKSEQDRMQNAFLVEKNKGKSYE